MVDQPVQRREDRKDVNWIAVIRFADGSDHPCTVKDVSASGLKVCVAADQELPETFMIKVVGMQLVFRVKQAWRRRHYVGVTIEKVAKLPDPRQAPLERDERPSASASESASESQTQYGHARLGTRVRRFEAG